MISIELTDTKDFMNKLLRTEIFDNFLLQEVVITKAASYVIDGHLQKGFYSSTELEENGIAGYSILPFRMLRTNCFDLIKGRQTPSSFKFVFLLSPENMEHTLSSLHSAFTVSDISGFFINIRLVFFHPFHFKANPICNRSIGCQLIGSFIFVINFTKIVYNLIISFVTI